MSLIEKARHHLPRILHTLGLPLRLGPATYRLRGYHADRLARDFSDEPHSVPVIRRALENKAGAFLDVGANCGQTLIKVLSIDSRREYFGFEPQISCCFYIDQFLQVNRIATAKVIPVAMSNTNGMCELFWESQGSVTASVVPQDPRMPASCGSLHSSWVPARRGDELIDELGIGAVAAIKIDVEGHELEVLQGLEGTIATMRPAIMFEVLRNFEWGEPIDDPAVRRERQARADAIFAMLTGYGYTIFSVDRFGSERAIHAFALDEEPESSTMNDGRDYVARQ